MSNERMCCTEDEIFYGIAWSLLRGRGNFENYKDLPSAAKKIADAIEVIRSNRSEYRNVFIKGLDDSNVDIQK